ncbi:MAG: ABC transporter ATP-binding protein [Armatimonadetes bacterium]|nr:ABC transporter ATP-binding protein [Armatimonadota bacterium]
MLIAKGLVRRYGQLVAVDHLDIEVAPGTCFGLLGPNGAGKTSTIGALVGLVRPDEGKVTLDGQEVSPSDHRVRARIGYVPQEIAIYEELDAKQNLRFFAGLYGISGPDADNRIAEALELAGLLNNADKPVRTFSGGMKRRLNLVAALLHKPHVLVMDEPTVGVDPQSRNAIFEAVERLVELGMTCVYTSHYMEEVERLCDRIAIMDHGKIVAQGTKSELEKLLPPERSMRLTFANEDLASVAASSLGRAGLKASREGNVVTTEFTDLGAALAAVGQACAASPPLEMHSQAPSLEEVFLHLTGKSLRD